MNRRFIDCRHRTAAVALGLITAFLAAERTTLAQDKIGVVSLLSGSPRMVGESIRPLQAILSGQLLETGDADAAGLLVEDIVIHVGVSSAVTLADEPGLTRVVIQRGFVVFYTDPTSQTRIVAETPLGELLSIPATAENGGSGWYSVRHDPERVGVSPAVSTFATMEGVAQVAGTNPVAGPHTLSAGQRWQIIQGQIPGDVEERDERASAEALRQTLHRESIETLRPEVTDAGRLTTLTEIPGTRPIPGDVIVPNDQGIVDPNAFDRSRVIPLITPQPKQIDFGPATIVAAAEPATASAQFVSYPGTPTNQSFNDFLASVDGQPAFQPLYLTAFSNGGFSYLQIAGPGAQVVSRGGDTFLFEDAQTASGWALYTPLRALRDSGFAPDSPAAGVITDGFAAIARGEHLTGGGTIGAGGDPASGFAIVADGAIQLNPTPPVGYPVLDQANQTAGLEINGTAPGDQVAALGAGLDPQDLSVEAPQLVFISTGQTDSLGNQFNFDGNSIEPTNLDLPTGRTAQEVAATLTSQPLPLAASDTNTVGIQFAATGETIAIIHHTGSNDLQGATPPASEHFEVVRGATFSIIQWRPGARITGGDGQPIDFEDLNNDPQVRNELFSLVCGEVNALVPLDRHTVCGPSVNQPTPANAPILRRRPGSLTLNKRPLVRRAEPTRHRLSIEGNRLTKPRVSLQPADGRLIRSENVTSGRRHIGRVSRDH